MEIQQLLGFIAVAKTGSFSAAARRTHRTQPAVSLQVRALEQEFGTRLFERLGPQRVTLTEEGRLLYDLVEPIVGGITQLEERFNEARKKLDRFSVTVASHNAAILYLLPDVVKAFAKQFPKAKLSVVNRPREGILSMVKNDEAHLGITSIVTPPAWAEYEVLGRFRRVLICRKDHPLMRSKKMPLAEIARHPLILPPIGSNTRAAIDEAFRKEGLTYELALEVTGREAVKSFVEAGLGLSILSEYYLSREDRKSLMVTDVSTYFGHSEAGLLTRRGRYLNHGVRYFADLVRRELRSAGQA